MPTKKLITMHANSIWGGVWKLLILFTIIWIIIFAAEPEWVKKDGVVNKPMISWYSAALAIIITVILVIVQNQMAASALRAEVHQHNMQVRAAGGHVV